MKDKEGGGKDERRQRTDLQLTMAEHPYKLFYHSSCHSAGNVVNIWLYIILYVRFKPTKYERNTQDSRRRAVTESNFSYIPSTLL